jgi:hypothetical protein
MKQTELFPEFLLGQLTLLAGVVVGQMLTEISLR